MFSNKLLRLSISFVDDAKSYDTDLNEDEAEDDQVDGGAEKDGKLVFSISCSFLVQNAKLKMKVEQQFYQSFIPSLETPIWNLM